MTRTAITLRAVPDGRPRRRRAARPLDAFGPMPEARSAAALDDAAEARRLIDDLLALVDAGLVAVVHDEHGARYAAAGDRHAIRPAA